MIIASIKSEKFPGLNDLNDIPFIGAVIIACGSMLPMFVIQELVQQAFGRSDIFNLSTTFFFNNLCFHVFLMKAFDVRIKLFFVSSIIFCLFCVCLNFYREYDLIISIIYY